MPVSPACGARASRRALRSPSPLLPAVAAVAALLGALAAPPVLADTPPVTGAGSSAAAPVYRTWASEYAKSGGAPLAYDPVGSTAGMERIARRQVDFGASDVFANPADLRQQDLVMFPTVVTGVVPVVNLPHATPSAPPLRLTGEVLARIFLGELKSWDAPEIQALNPQAKLPAMPIRLVARSDGSGTTWHFTEYLSHASADWKRARGVAAKLDWPAGTVAAKGSTAVSEAVRATPGAIGYIDFNYVLDDHLAGVSLRNAAGEYVVAGVEGFREAVTHSGWYTDGDFSQSLADRPGKATWPVTMGTYVAVPRVGAKGRTEEALRFVIWSYLHGDALARQAKFVPLPDKVQANAYREISRVTDAGGEPVGMKLMGALVR